MNQGFFKSSSIHETECAIIFAEKMRGSFAMEKLLTFFGPKMAVFFAYKRFDLLVLNKYALIYKYS